MYEHTCKKASHMIFIIVRNGKVNLLICSFGARQLEQIINAFDNNKMKKKKDTLTAATPTTNNSEFNCYVSI